MGLEDKLFKGYDDLRKDFERIRSVVESGDFPDAKLAQIELILKEALTPLHGDDAMEAAKRRVIKKHQEKEKENV